MRFHVRRSLTVAATGLGLLAAVLWLHPGGVVSADEEKAAEEKPARPAPPPSQTFVGTLEGAPASARIGLVISEASALIYLCSQDDSFNKDHSEWLKGTAKDGAIQAESKGASLKGMIKGDKAEGTVSFSGGKALNFTAKLAPEGDPAGLYRAEEKVGDEDYVFGWVADSEGGVAGAVRGRNQARPQTLPAARNPAQNGLQGQVQGQQNPVRGQRVNDPQNPPQGQRASKFDAAKRQQIQQATVARLQASNGSCLQGMVVNQMKRFLSGAKAGSPIEQQTFARLARVNRNALQQYISGWDALPQNVRNALAPEAAQLGTQVLTAERARPILNRGNIVAAKQAAPAAKSASIRRVTAATLRCIDESEPERIVVNISDEIFCLYLVTSGDLAFSRQTQVYKGFDDGEAQGFSAADAVIFPPPENPNAVANQDVTITVTMFEDDTGEIAALATVVKAAADLGLIIASAVTGNAAPAGLGPAINALVDAAAAAFPSAQLLGADTMIVRTNGQRVGLNGAAKTEFRVNKTTNGAGGPYDYRVQGVQVQQ